MKVWLMSRRWMVVFIATYVAFGFAGVMAKDKKSQATDAPEGSAVLPVKASRARKPASDVQFDVPGTVRAATDSMLSFRVSGLVETIPIKCGQPVKKGDLIAKLDTAHYESQKNQAQASLKQLQSRAKAAKTEYDRIRKLWAKKDVSQRKLENVRAAMQSAKESVIAARKRLDEAKRQLEYATLRAPYDGLIAHIPGSAHENVGAGQPIARLVSRKRRFKAFIPPKIWRRKDDFVGYRCVFPALGDAHVKARLHSIGSSALPPHRLIPLEVNLLETGKTPIIPGMEGIVRITVKKRQSDIACLLPASAIVATSKGQSQVWKVDRKNNTVKPIKVKTGELQNGMVVIKSGIQPGKWVVTAGQNVLNSGQKVRIVQSHSDQE